MRHIIRKADAAGVKYEDVSAPAVDDSTGTPYLAARVRLIYRYCDED